MKTTKPMTPKTAVITLSRFLLILSMLLFCFSCKKDDEVVISNRVIIDVTTYELVSGFFDNNPDMMNSADTPPQQGFAQEILFISTGLTMNTSTGIVSGNGSAIVFNPFTAAQTLSTGSFLFPEPYSEKIGFLLDAYACKNYNAATDECEIEYDGESGTLTIGISGSTYTIKFVGKMVYEDASSNEISVDVDLSFEGTLTGVDL